MLIVPLLQVGSTGGRGNYSICNILQKEKYTLKINWSCFLIMAKWFVPWEIISPHFYGIVDIYVFPCCIIPAIVNMHNFLNNSFPFIWFCIIIENIISIKQLVNLYLKVVGVSSTDPLYQNLILFCEVNEGLVKRHSLKEISRRKTTWIFKDKVTYFLDSKKMHGLKPD